MQKGIYPPPLHIANVLAHARVLGREIKRAEQHEFDEAVLKDLRKLRMLTVMLNENLGFYFDLEDQV